jgi:hypothetical protein
VIGDLGREPAERSSGLPAIVWSEVRATCFLADLRVHDFVMLGTIVLLAQRGTAAAS